MIKPACLPLLIKRLARRLQRLAGFFAIGCRETCRSIKTMRAAQPPPRGLKPAPRVEELLLPDVSPLLPDDPLVPDEPLPVAPPDVPLVAAVGTACAVQVNDGVVLLVLVLLVEEGSAHMTTRFLVVSIYHTDTGVVVPLVLVVPALLLLGISGMYGSCPLDVVVVCADAIPAGIASVAIKREIGFMSSSSKLNKRYELW